MGLTHLHRAPIHFQAAFIPPIIPSITMTHLDLAALFILIAIPLLAVAALWQLYIMLSETHTLNRYQKQPRQMLWIAITLFFTFSLSVYWYCPNARKKGVLFALLSSAGIVCYALGMWYKNYA